MLETGGSTIIAGQKYIGEIEQQVRDLITNSHVDRRVALFVPRFQELANLGAHSYKPEVLLDYLLPAIESRTIHVIGIINPHAYAAVIQKWPGLRMALEIIRIEPATESEALDEVRELIGELEVADGDSERDRLAKETLQLIRQYTSSEQLPGSALNLLHVAAQELPADRTQLTRSDLVTTISRVTGLPKEILDEEQHLDIEELRSAFTDHVIGQDEAVDCLVERIAMIKAGLSDPSKPSAVLLFAGPTGSGKTEAAKTLAQLLFGSQDRMTRLDMSEFQTPESAEKLTGVPSAGQDQRSLITRIREQPFSVVLLDEFEKAHARVWDLFLQVFDDGRLTDTHGNVADFRHAIIILTSNLGATINPNAGMGFVGSTGQFDPQDVMETIARTFRREFLNRLDRVLVFKPLTRESMRQILHLQLKAALRRRGFRNREWAVEWEETAVDFLLDKGFTLDLGARPLKRAIEQHFLAPLSKNIVENRFPKGDQFLFVRAPGDQLEVEFVDPDQEPQAPDSEPTTSDKLSFAHLVLHARGHRSEYDFLTRKLARALDLLTNDEWTRRKTHRLASCNNEGFWNQPGRHQILGDIELMDRMESALQATARLGARLKATPTSKELTRTLAQRLYLLELAYDDLLGSRPYEAFLSIKSLDTPSNSREPLSPAALLEKMYFTWANKRGMRYRRLNAETIDGILAVTGFGAHTILAHENGIHVFEDGDKARVRVRVSVAPQPTAPEHDPKRFAVLAEKALATTSNNELVRRYQTGNAPMVRDIRANWRTGRLQKVLEGDFDLFGSIQ